MYSIYEQQEQVNSLHNFIKSFTKNQRQHNTEIKAKEADLEWQASLFLAKAIQLSQPLNYECDLGNYFKFKEEYQQINNCIVDSDKLFQEFWLRNVLGFVEIAGTVSSVCYTFNEISGFREELEFLVQFCKDKVKEQRSIDKNILEDAIKIYESENNIKLNKKGIYCKSWISEKDDKIEISDIEIYFKPFLKYWTDFEFLTAFKALTKIEREGLIIEKEVFEQLHQSFHLFYLKTPSVQKLIDVKLISFKNDLYYLNFNDSEINYWYELSDKIAAHYWEILIEDKKYSSDEERIRKFIEQTFYWESSLDICAYITDDDKIRFLDSAFNLILNESDIEGIDKEFQKVSIDRSCTSSELYNLFYHNDNHDDFSLDNTDNYELLKSLDHRGNKAQTTYYHDQKSREKLVYLINMIVEHDFDIEYSKNDDEDNPENKNYRRIFTLLRNSLNKPFLLWEITRNIISNRKEIIPYLIVDKYFTSLAFQLIDEFEFPKDERNELRSKLWIKCIDLALFTIRSVLQEDNLSAKMIFQIYRQLNYLKYEIPYNRQSKKAELLSSKQEKEREHAILLSIENSLLYNYDMHGSEVQYLLPSIFNNLAELFINFQIKSLYQDGYVQFPMLQWDGITWLMKCSTYWKYKNKVQTTPDIKMLANSFFDLYKNRIELTKVKMYNYSEKKEVEDFPLWSEKIERLEFIDWIYPVYFIYKEGKLNNFLSPTFNFKPTSSKQYHRENQFTAEKLRTHIGVLLQIIRTLALPNIPYGFDENELKEIKIRIEQQIIDYLKNHMKDIPIEGKIDLFDFSKEQKSNSSKKEALLPQFARAFYWFKEKETLIDIIVNSNDIIKILTFTELITSEGVKKKLIEKVKKSDLQSFLEKSHWIPEIQTTLLKITLYPELIKQIEIITKFWEEKIAQRDYKFESQLYQTRLLLSYFQKDEKTLDSIIMPENKGVVKLGEISNRDHKEFYRALIRLEAEPKIAYSIFDRLSKQYQKYSNIAMNRMAAKVQMAKEEDNIVLFREALEEWNEYINSNPEIDESLFGITFYANKILILYKTQQYNELDITYQNLDLSFKMLPSIIDSKVKSLVTQKKVAEAISLLNEAERFHQFAGNEEIEFINDLKSEVEGIDYIEILKTHYNHIFDSKPSNLIKIFPEKLNGKVVLNEFIANEFALAGSKMLDKIMTISEIADENKYNDIIELVLDSRINPWGWYVGAQSRGGFPGTGKLILPKQPGERDLPIMGSNKRPICICEAFIYRSKCKAKEHLRKIFDYYHQRDSLIILIYNLKQNGAFEDNWKKYVKEIIPHTKFPLGFEFESIEDVTGVFDYQNSAIKIGQSRHSDGIVMHHIYVNIDYKTTKLT